MKIYADFRWPAGTGIGVVQRSLIQHLPARFELHDLHVRGRIGHPLSPAALTYALLKCNPRKGAFWNPGFIPPLYSKIPTVVTVHDLIHLRTYSRLHVTYYNQILKPLYRRCTAIICVSEFTRSEFIEWSGIPGDRVFTIHNGVSEAFWNRDSFEPLLPFPYVFYPGNRRSHKNLPRLFEAFSISSLPGRGVHLVMTGDSSADLQQLAHRFHISDKLHFVGNVDDTTIIRLYRGALIVAYVSFYEGFGLPVIEAMAAGVPVLAANATAIPEVAGSAAVLVDPTRPESIAEGLEQLAWNEEERQLRIRLGEARARTFTWEQAATKLTAVFDQISGPRG